MDWSPSEKVTHHVTVRIFLLEANIFATRIAVPWCGAAEVFKGSPAAGGRHIPEPVAEIQKNRAASGICRIGSYPPGAAYTISAALPMAAIVSFMEISTVVLVGSIKRRVQKKPGHSTSSRARNERFCSGGASPPASRLH